MLTSALEIQGWLHLCAFMDTITPAAGQSGFTILLTIEGLEPMKNKGMTINLSDLSIILYIIVSSGSFLRRVCYV